jgi:hypothetical protein
VGLTRGQAKASQKKTLACQGLAWPFKIIFLNLSQIFMKNGLWSRVTKGFTKG